jgi:hypothetical protein
MVAVCASVEASATRDRKIKAVSWMFFDRKE